jgi:hypothetical protein
MNVNPSGKSRLKLATRNTLAWCLLAASSLWYAQNAHAQNPTASIALSNIVIENNSTSSATASSTIADAPGYAFSIKGTVSGAGNFYTVQNEDFGTFVDSVTAGTGAKSLSGTILNPTDVETSGTESGYTLPATLVTQNVVGDAGNATLTLSVNAKGRPSLQITDVQLPNSYPGKTSSIRFDSGTATVSPVFPPTATTNSAGTITQDSAVLSATVSPQGASTQVQFTSGTDTTYGSFTPKTTLAAGYSATQVQANLSGLKLGQTYHYRVIASNLTGTTVGDDETFTAQYSAPLAVTEPATRVSGSQATLEAEVNPLGLVTSVHFEYGTDTTYGSSTPPIQTGTGTTILPESAKIEGISPDLLYHYRVVASSIGGTTYGADQIFESNFPFSKFAGTYQGAIETGTPSSSGILTLTVNSIGSYTVSIHMGADAVHLQGRFESAGNASILSGAIPIALQLGGYPGPETLAVQIGAPLNLDFSAYKAVSSTLPARYTLRLPTPGPAFPQGYGYAAMSLSKTGAIAVHGQLGDGAPLTATAILLQNQTWVLYYRPYLDEGMVLGTIVIESSTGGDMDGTVYWDKPDITANKVFTPGFDTQTTLYGSTYIQPKNSPVIATTSGTTQLSGGGLTAPLAIDTTLERNTFTFAPPANGLKIAVSLPTGLFAGTFVNPDTQKATAIHGALFQGTLNCGYGIFTGTSPITTGTAQEDNETGSIAIFPPQ